MSPATDESWRKVAENARGALALLGYFIGPRCLPHEPDACGGTYAEHAAANLAAIQAVTAHQLAHLDAPPTLVFDVMQQVSAELHGCSS